MNMPNRATEELTILSLVIVQYEINVNQNWQEQLCNLMARLQTFDNRRPCVLCDNVDLPTELLCQDSCGLPFHFQCLQTNAGLLLDDLTSIRNQKFHGPCCSSHAVVVS